MLDCCICHFLPIFLWSLPGMGGRGGAAQWLGIWVLGSDRPWWRSKPLKLLNFSTPNNPYKGSAMWLPNVTFYSVWSKPLMNNPWDPTSCQLLLPTIVLWSTDWFQILFSSDHTIDLRNFFLKTSYWVKRGVLQSLIQGNNDLAKWEQWRGRSDKSAGVAAGPSRLRSECWKPVELTWVHTAQNSPSVRWPPFSRTSQITPGSRVPSAKPSPY